MTSQLEKKKITKSFISGDTCKLCNFVGKNNKSLKSHLCGKKHVNRIEEYIQQQLEFDNVIRGEEF
jgi:hypothetical protein